MTRKLIYITLFCGTLATLFSCGNSDCVLTNTSYAQFGFYSQGGAAVSITGTVTVTAAGTDSVLVNRESGPTLFQLPLSYTNLVDTFVVYFTDEVVDSVFVTHENVPHFLSMDCGTGMYHNLQGVRSTNNVIDSIKISDPEVTYDAKENIKMYFTVSE